MTDPIVACVRTGTKFGFEYVTKLRNMVSKNFMQPHRIVCLTDQPERCEWVDFVDITEARLVGWWAKMMLFEPAWRERSRIIYLDLDTVVIGDLTPLVLVPHEFAILESPVRLAGNKAYPCAYNSSVMTIGEGACTHIWKNFDRRRSQLMLAHDRYGDQAAIEELYPDAPSLQKLMPKGFFCNYRDLTNHQPHASVINFGGTHKPHNCPIAWVQQAWV